MYTLVVSANLNAVDQQAWLTNLLSRLADVWGNRLADHPSWNCTLGPRKQRERSGAARQDRGSKRRLAFHRYIFTITSRIPRSSS